jgi:hypothetical protein
MTLLLTILSVLVFWAFLQLLIFGLYLIFKPLEGVRIYLEKITMGVRAIERQTRPLPEQSRKLIASLTTANTLLQQTNQRLERVDEKLF